MSDPIDRAVIDIPCPNCGKILKQRVGWISAHPDFACTCGQRFEAADISRKARQARDRLAASLKKELEKLAKRFKR